MTNKNDRFTELDHVGRGAFGEVVVAHDSVLNRHVAIKRYYKKTSELGDVTKSVTHWSKLTHPNIAQVLDYRDQDGSFSVTMTFCSKGELLQLLPELKDDQVRLASYFSQIGSAVAYIHAQNLVHRDLKLSNIMIDASESPVLIDLDLCVEKNSTVGKNQVGTLGYIAPELSHEDAMYSVQSDLFALGVILFEMVTGKPGDSIARMSNDRQAGPGHLRDLTSQTVRFRDWNAIISKATHPNPKQRYAHATELVSDVEKLVEGKPISARTISRSERAIRYVQNNPLTSMLLVASVAIILIGTSTGLYLWRQASKARTQVQSNTQELSQRVKEAELRRAELAALISTVRLELTQVEKSELEQRKITESAQSNRLQLQQEAERAQELTAELNSLLARAQASAEGVKVAEKSRDQAASQLEQERKKLEQKNYSAKVIEIWGSISDQLWEKAQKELQTLPRSNDLDYRVINSALRNKLPRPVRIELDLPPTRYFQDCLKELKDGKEQKFRVRHDDSLQVAIRFARANIRDFGCTVRLQLPETGSLYYSVGPLKEADKIVALLQDGSLLVSSSTKLSIWTFSPDEYSTTSSRSLRDVDVRLKQTIVELERVDQTEPPPTRRIAAIPAKSELEAWKYFRSVSRIGYSDDGVHMVNITFSNREPVPSQQFSLVSSLSMLKHGNFAFSQVDDDCVASLSKCSQLEHLNFWSASKITDTGIKQLKDLPNLNFLNIGMTQASLEAIDEIVLGNLETLYLNKTKLRASRLSRLSNCKKLKTLSIYLMNITDQDLEVLKQLPALVALDIGPATITDRGFDTIIQLSKLKHLDVKGTPVSEAKIDEFRRTHPDCKVLR